MKRISLLGYMWFFFVGWLQVGWAQEMDFLNHGNLLTQHYDATDYQGGSQTWDVLQGDDGTIYMGGSLGLYQFDGVNWKLSANKDFGIVRDLALASDGTIYYCGGKEGGYLSKDSIGNITLVPITSLIQDEIPRLGYIDIIPTEEEVYLLTLSQIFRFTRPEGSVLAPSSFSVEKMPLTGEIIRGGKVGDIPYVFVEDQGLYELSAGQIQHLDSAKACGEIISIFPGKDPDGIAFPMLVNKQGQFFTWKDNILTPFTIAPSLAKDLVDSRVFLGYKLENGTIALGTLDKGLFLIGPQGNLLRNVDKQSGLQGNAVSGIGQDRQGGLWICHHNGVDRILYPSSTALFDHRQGIDLTVYTMVHHRGRIYLGGSQGVLCSSILMPGEAPSFSQVPGPRDQMFSLTTFQDKVYGAGGMGIVEVLPDQQIPVIKPSFFPFVLKPSSSTEGLFLVSGNGGMGFLILGERKPRFIEMSEPLNLPIRQVEEVSSGVFWLAGRPNSYVRVEVPALMNPSSISLKDLPPKLEAQVSVYPMTNEESGGRTKVFRVGDEVVLAGNSGIKRFDPESEEFIPDSTYHPNLAEEGMIVLDLASGADGEIWSHTYQSPTLFGRLSPQGDGSYVHSSIQSLASESYQAFHYLYPDPYQPDKVWIYGAPGILFYDPEIEADFAYSYPTRISQISTGGDSILFNGTKPSPGELPYFQELAYAHNNLRFDYSALSFNKPEENQYQVYLEGFDEDWSDWTDESRKDYTNIPEGSYTFRVRSKNIYQTPGAEDHFSFRVSPPWYRSLWAYLTYGLIAAGLVYLLVRYRERRLKQQNLELERIIADRTKELAQKNEELQELDSYKTRFFANISHELRTPITLILGPVQHLLQKVKPTKPAELNDSLSLIQRNGQSLLTLVEELLEISRLDAGKAQLDLQPTAFYPFQRQLFSAFESQAEFKEIAYNLDYQLDEDLVLGIDKNKVSKIVNNLISNALKFTSKDGQVQVSIDQLGEQWRIQVKDSGRGIPPEDLPHVFERYFQTKVAEISTEGGTGIGLSLSRELAHLMKGDLQVDSVWESGSTFSFVFPAKVLDSLPPQEEVQPLPASSSSHSSEIAENLPMVQEGPLPKLLIVEDNQDMQQLIQGLLSDTYTCILAQNGYEAWEMLNSEDPKIQDISLILSDIMMPRMDGYGLLEKVKQHDRWRKTPIIMLTARAAEQDKLTALRMGVDDYLTKPFSPSELKARLANLIANYQAREEFKASQPEGFQLEFSEAPSADEQWLTQLESHTLDALEKRIKLNAAYLADAMALSERQLLRRIKASTGLSITKYIQEIKLQKARHALENRHFLTIAEVAYAAGFNTPGYFSKVFESRFGKLPSTYLETLA